LNQPSLKARALRCLAARELSRLELERKLAGFEQEPGQLARLLDELEAKGFISQQRIVESVLHRRAARLGADRIRQELESRGLDEEAVARAMQTLKTTEHERALAVWRKKFGHLPLDAAERGKQMRFLAGRGFAPELVRQIVARRAAAQDDG
jgi:regulatory protein